MSRMIAWLHLLFSFATGARTLNPFARQFLKRNETTLPNRNRKVESDLLTVQNYQHSRRTMEFATEDQLDSIREYVADVLKGDEAATKKTTVSSLWDSARFILSGLFDCHVYNMQTTIRWSLDSDQMQASDVQDNWVEEAVYWAEGIYLELGETEIEGDNGNWTWQTLNMGYRGIASRDTGANAVDVDVDWLMQMGGTNWPTESLMFQRIMDDDLLRVLQETDVQPDTASLFLNAVTETSYSCPRDPDCPTNPGC